MKSLKYPLMSLVLIALISIIYIFSDFQSPDLINVKQVSKASIGSAEDPQARFNHEMMRLRNPATGKIPANIRAKELEFASRLPVHGDGLILKTGDSKDVQFANSWSLRGPHNVAGRTRAMALDITNENIIIAGGVSGGMWRSSDGGSNWIKTSGYDQLHSVTCLVQDTRSGKENIWYYGTGEYRGNSASGSGAFFVGDGIYKSTNGGESWSVLPSTTSNSPQTFNLGFDIVWNVALDPSNTSQEEVYTAAYGRIFRSINGGGNWSEVIAPSDPNSARYTDVTVTSTGVVYATLSGNGNKSGIHRSTNGTTWTEITPAGWPGTYNRVVIGIAPSNENVVYFLAETPGYGTCDHSIWKYTYLSGDGSGSGGQWENRSANIPAQGGYTGNFDSQGSYDLVIKVKPNDENVVFIGGVNLYRSNDGFASSAQTTWIGGYTSSNNSYASYPNHHCDQHALFFYPSDPNKMLSGHDAGICLTTNDMATNVSWTVLNNGYYTTQFYTVAIDHAANGDNIIIGGMQDNGSWFVNSASSTANWVDEWGGDGSYCAIADGKNYYYFSWQNGETFRVKLDNSGNLLEWAEVDPAGGTGYLFINPFILDANNSKMMYMAGGSVIWRNSDLTQIPAYDQNPTSVNWTKLTNTQLSSGSVSALEVSISPANRLYYGTSEKKVYRLDNANTGNPTPTDITGASFPSGYVSCIAVDPSNADNLLVVFSNYEVISLWYSSNGGSSWQNISGNLEQYSNGSGNGPSTRWAEILPLAGETMYFVGTSTGLYSTNLLNGTSTVWSQEGPSTIGNVVVDMLDSRTTDDLLVAATHGTGVYSTNVSTFIGDEENPAIVKNYFLGQNYPNPFNPTTTIEYKIPQAAEVSLTIYNIQGKEIVTLVRQHQGQGSYVVTWNGRDRLGRTVTSGAYFYRLNAGKYSETRRMVLVK
jgi:hypothetical protein